MTRSQFPELHELVEVSVWLAQKGWSEAGSGNISVRLDRLPNGVSDLGQHPPQPLPLSTPALENRYMVVTAAGSRSREMANRIDRSVGIFRVLEGGEQMECLWGNPTVSTEFPTHAAVHNMLTAQRPHHRAVLHSHPANLIALTHLPRMRSGRDVSDALLRMQSEAHVNFPDGLRYLPYSTPGSVAIGRSSAEAMRDSSVLLWHMHGALATGETLSRALDYLEYVDKLAEIYWILRSAGVHPRGMTDDDIRDALEHFDLWDRHLSAQAMSDRVVSR